MQTYKIEFEKSATKFLSKQEKSTRLRLYKAIYKLPFKGDIKKLQGSNLYRLRVGGVRILYRVDHEIRIVYVDTIDGRGDVYKQI